MQVYVVHTYYYEVNHSYVTTATKLLFGEELRQAINQLSTQLFVDVS
jgi:hypothetical protein